MGYQLPVPEMLAAGVGRSGWRIKIALGLTAFAPGAVSTVLNVLPKPKPSHSLVTPTQAPALFWYSTRIQGPVMFVGVVGMFVSSPISGHVVQVFFNPASVYG